jgi:hypothetical protein
MSFARDYPSDDPPGRGVQQHCGCSSGMAMLASGCFGLEIASDGSVHAIKIPLAVCTLNEQFNKMGYLTGVIGVDTIAL